MENKRKLRSISLASVIMILFLIIISSMAIADPGESSSSTGPFAYVTNYDSNTVSVIDTSNDTVIATINAGNYPDAVSVNSAGTKVYVANRNSGIISVIDTATNTVTATVSVGSYPIGVVVDPTGTNVYVANRDSNNVSIINVTTNTVTATIDVEFPHGIAVNPAGTKVYVARELDSIVSVIDVDTNTVTANISVGSYPVEVAVSPDGTKVYVANQEGTVSVIDTETNTVIATVNVGNYPLGVAVSPDGTRVYVTNSGSSTVSVIDTVTNNVVATVAVGNYPFGVSVTPDGTKVYVANSYSNTVSVIDTATNNVTNTINVGSEPHSFGKFIGPLQVSPVANFSSNVTEGYAPLSVQFTDLSEYATGWYWDFGDVTNSTEQNPTHTYSTAGNYNVNLIIINSKGKDSKLATINVLEQPLLPVANFSTNLTSGFTPLTVQFNDSSENATELDWDFENDGVIDSNLQDPVHLYSIPGIYTVNLTAINQNGTDSKLATITVLEQTLPPVANFDSNVTQGYLPLTVQFTDISENATEWSWNFGDNTCSTAKNPVHTYSKARKYTVSLTVKNENGMDTEKRPKYISVSKRK